MTCAVAGKQTTWLVRKMVKAPREVRDFLRKIAKQGGKRTASKRTPKERSAAARKAVNARWAKYRAAKRESGSPERAEANKRL